MLKATLRIDLFALYDDDDPRVYAGSLLRDNVAFAVAPHIGDNVRGLAADDSVGLSGRYRVSYMEHWPAFDSADEATCWVVCQGAWPAPGTSEDFTFDALQKYEEDGWRVSLVYEVEQRYRDFQTNGGLPVDMRLAHDDNIGQPK